MEQGPGSQDAPDDEVVQAEADAAAIVRAAFTQAERVNKQAEDAKAEAERVLAEAKAEADRLLASVAAEREHLLEVARRDRVAAEEALLRARTEAEREKDQILSRATELARREAEILLDGSKTELLRARDEANAIRAAAERDAEAIIAAATARARSTSAEILAATRRRLTEHLPGGSQPGQPVAGDLADDRPPPGPSADLLTLAAITEFVTGKRPEALVDAIVEEVRLVTAWHTRRYKMNWPKTPRPEDIDNLMELAVTRAVAKVFETPTVLWRDGADAPYVRPADAEVIDLTGVMQQRSA